MNTYFGCHNHTMYSNLRLLDCINKPETLIDKAIELGLSGIAITDHESLSAHMTVNQYAKKIKEKYPDFKIALGNEIYLTDDRSTGQKYYHFILIAKDAIGYRALKELSSIAWQNLYIDRKMERVPLLKNELKPIVEKYKGHLIATTACIGGELGTCLLKAVEYREQENSYELYQTLKQIDTFLTFCKDLFGEDFYLEIAPSTAADQKLVNHMIYKIGRNYGIKVEVATDSHYLTKEDRPIHKAYLNSKDGEREVDKFYEFAHLMTYDEVFELITPCFIYLDIEEQPEEIAKEILNNTLEIQNKIEDFSLERKQIIPKVEVTDYPQSLAGWFERTEKYPILCSLLMSDNPQERYWVNECYMSLLEKMYNKSISDDKLDIYLNRLEIEADIIKDIGEKLDDCLFAYFNTFKHYIDLFWKCGSIVGPGRGSATGFLSNYLLGITQIDPIRWGLPYWRFLNKERAELPDIDIDLAPSKRPAIFKAIREERGDLGLVQVATFGTEGTKSAVLTACRGYRSEDFPEGIDNDQAQYMSSLIPQERGFLWPIHDVIYGNEEKDRKPIQAFIREVNQYDGLLDIIIYIEGIINKRSSHASGVILYGDDPFETASFMRTPSGDIITCYDLHKAEAAGDTKYDFLVTEASDKIITCYQLLLKDNQIPDLPLREFYNKYIHPEVIDTADQRIWDHLAAGDVLDVFQFSTGVGLAIAKRLKPQDPMEMTAANAMMRLMSEKGKESQQDRYYRIQHQGIQVFDAEMKQNHLPQDLIDKFHKHCDKYYGCCPIQEQMMEILMDIAGFTLGEANSARKVVAKKQMSKIPQLKEQVFSKFDDPKVAEYFWEIAVAPQLGYAFSLNHSLPYSFVAIQMIYLVINYNPIYWDTACLIVNSGSLEDNTEEELVDIYAPEGDDLANGVTFEDLPDKSAKIRRTASTDYGKIAKAISDIQKAGIEVGLPDINKSKFGFAPDIENNKILFGLKGMLNVGDDLVNTIITNRPYISPKDFLYRIKPSKQAMISLIKGGAFDNMMDRKLLMGWYIWETCDKKSRITLQNMSSLIKYKLLPEDTDKQIMARRVFEFNRYLKAVCKDTASFYKLDTRAINFLVEIGEDNLIEEGTKLDQKIWDKKVYEPWMDVFRDWISENKTEILENLNTVIFKEDWDKYTGKNNLSAWEMEVLCFYYHSHELKDINNKKYGFADFFALPQEPEVDRSFSKGGKTIHIYKLNTICGTCIAKNKTKSTVTILTTTGPVEVKFRKEYFSLFDKQISEKGPDGVKHIVEKSWFNRGSMIIVMGVRQGDNFIAKKYASSPGHQLYKIDEIFDDGTITLRNTRYQGGIEEDV